MRRSFQAGCGFCLLALWFAAVNGWQPLLIVLGAAFVHELGHCLMLRLLGTRASAFRLTLFGMELQTDSCAISYGKELLAVLAGPAANLVGAVGLCILNKEAYVTLIGANVVLCVFNLLPVRFLDGGRALELLRCWIIGPAAGERLLRGVSAVTAFSIAGVLAWVMRCTCGSLWLLPPTLGMLRAGWREIRGQ